MIPAELTQKLLILILLVSLAGIAIIDFRRLIIPDWLNLAVAACGFAFHAIGMRGVPWRAVAFAGIVALGFAALRWLYRSFRGRTGIGWGDVKLASAAALWIEPRLYAYFLIVSCLFALAFVVVISRMHGAVAAETRIPFGPFLCLGLAILVFVQWRIGL